MGRSIMALVADACIEALADSGRAEKETALVIAAGSMTAFAADIAERLLGGRKLIPDSQRVLRDQVTGS